MMGGPPQFGGPGPMGMPPPFGGGMNGMDGGPPPGMNPNQPIINFRNGKFTTVGEMDAKSRQRLELQEALERQIAEKKWAKDQVGGG